LFDSIGQHWRECWFC